MRSYKPNKNIRFFKASTKYSEINWNDFNTVIDAFYDRIYNWYIEPVKELEKLSGHYAFPLMTSACLLIDCLSQYVNGSNESKKNQFINYAENNIPGFNNIFMTPIDYYFNNRITNIDNPAKVLYYAFRCGILHEARICLFGGITKFSSNELYKYYPSGYAYYDDGSDCPFIHIDPYNLINHVEQLLKNYCDRLKNNKTSDNILRINFKKKFKLSFGIEIGNE